MLTVSRTFEESIQKAFRMVDPRYHGFQGDHFDDLDHELANPTDVCVVHKSVIMLKY